MQPVAHNFFDQSGESDNDSEGGYGSDDLSNIDVKETQIGGFGGNKFGQSKKRKFNQISGGPSNIGGGYKKRKKNKKIKNFK